MQAIRERGDVGNKRERRRITDREAQVERNEKGNINEANKLQK